MFMALGPSGYVNDPGNQLFLNLKTPNYFEQYKKFPHNSGKHYFGKVHNFTNLEYWLMYLPTLFEIKNFVKLEFRKAKNIKNNTSEIWNFEWNNSI